MQRRSFKVDAITLSVAQGGSGRPFVFQHGLCGTADQAAQVFPKNSGFQCVTLECRGHGQSECGSFADLTLARLTQDLEAFIVSLNVGPIPVGGISMGAAITMRLAVTRPDLVSGLVIARPAWVDSSAPDNLEANREVGRLLAQYSPKEALARFQQTPIAQQLAREAPDNLASLLGFFDRKPIDETEALLGRLSNDGTGISKEQIMAIQCPTLIIATGRDALHPLAMARELANLVPDARLVEIASKADNIGLYQSQFTAALEQFFRDNQL
ncbi:MAG: alpha/beta hydrolase [Pseudomonadota bacterium]